MSGLVDIMDAIADQIDDTLTPLLSSQGVDLQVESGRLIIVNPPAVDVFPGAVAREGETRMFADDHDGGGYLFTVRTRFQTNDYDSNKRLMYEMMDDESPLSLAQAIVDGGSLDGQVASLDCFDPSGEQAYAEFGNDHIGFQFTVRALAAHS